MDVSKSFHKDMPIDQSPLESVIDGSVEENQNIMEAAEMQETDIIDLTPKELESDQSGSGSELNKSDSDESESDNSRSYTSKSRQDALKLKPSGHRQNSKNSKENSIKNQPQTPKITVKLEKYKRSSSVISDSAEERPPRKMTRFERELQMDLQPAMKMIDKQKRTESDVDDNPAGFDKETYKKIKAIIAQIKIDDKYSDIDYAFACFPGTEVPIPKSYIQAVAHPKYGKQWREAINEELNGIRANGTYEEVIPPKGSNIVGMKWVFTFKYNNDGSI
ncbi:hypothetical protein K3495_g8916 [Podosphaera aphanis]|nr:hypothetical protein K3495_g8916 [Podosphaera aphanis]